MSAKDNTGTGKHPHKSSKDPTPRRNVSGDSPSPARQQTSGSESGEKSREYRDKEGNIHHHTKSYMDQHKDH